MWSAIALARASQSGVVGVLDDELADAYCFLFECCFGVKASGGRWVVGALWW
jgi:hypothetical protein